MATGMRGGAAGRITSLSALGLLVCVAMACAPGDETAVTEDAAETPAMTGEVITLADIAAGTDTLQNRDLMLREVPVAAAMGQRAFWVELPNRQPYLIKLDADLAATGVTFQSGDTVDIAGRILTMSDSVISDWMTSGAITANQEAEARFATSFLQATDVRAAQ